MKPPKQEPTLAQHLILLLVGLSAVMVLLVPMRLIIPYSIDAIYYVVDRIANLTHK